MVIGQRVAVEAAWASTAATRWVGKGWSLDSLVAVALGLDSLVTAAGVGLAGVGAKWGLDLGTAALVGLAAAAAVTNSGTISISRTGLTIESR
jgi:hypothetical protein